MVEDILYKLARKRMGRMLYTRFSRSLFGRARRYERLPTYEAICAHYRQQGLSFPGKHVLEVGSGNQFFTALLFLSAGAKHVILVEPKCSVENLAGDLEEFNRATQGPRLDLGEVSRRIQVYPDLEKVPPEWNSNVDIACSHFVLEHFSDLPGFFRNIARLLAPTGVTYNRVDLTDHTYHIFDKYPLTRWILKRRLLYHLRYSNGMFAKINDDKCYMNRILLPNYLELADSKQLRLEKLSTVAHASIPVHDDLLAGLPQRDPNLLYVTHFGLMLTKKAPAHG